MDKNSPNIVWAYKDQVRYKFRFFLKLMFIVLLSHLILVGFLKAGIYTKNKSEKRDSSIKQIDRICVLPSGIIKIHRFSIPSGWNVVGARHGVKTILIAVPGCSDSLVTMGDGASLSDVAIEGLETGKIGIEVKDVAKVVLEDIAIEGCSGFGIEADHATNLTIKNCFISHCQRGVNLDFCHDVTVEDNQVENVRDHGIQFWGNWNWKMQSSTNLLFNRNRVVNGSGGGIWGSGATGVVMTENKVSNFGDVGLDLEWCSKGIISRNTIFNCRNAGIALFYSCVNVAITDNKVEEKAPIRQNEVEFGQWQGIWLTGVNKNVFPEDSGHSHVLIARNQILQVGASLSPIGINSNCKDIVEESNKVVVKPERD